MTFMTGAGALPAEQTALQYPTDSTDARMTTVVPSSATPFISRGEASTNLTVSNDKDSVTTLWAKKQRSFLSFLTRLASQVKSQNQNQNQNESKTLTQQQLPGILRVTIDDWDSHETTMDLLNTLFKLDQLQELSIRHSVLRQIAPDPTIMAEWVVADGDELRYGQEHQPLSRFSKDATLLACQHLTRLDLRDCVHLRDLSEINQWMPNLLDINLEGCLGIDDFRPLSQVDKVLMKTYIPTDDATSAAEYRRWQHGKQKKQEQEQEEQPQYLHVRRLNLSRTSIRDRDLISILERAPCLEELRLDQCYDLTTASLVAIGMGNHLQYAAHGGNSSFSAITVIDSTSVTSGSPPVDTIANSDSSSSITEVTTTTSSVPELKILSVKNCCDLSDEGIRALVGCRRLELLIIRGLRRVPDSTIEWLHEQGVPLRRVLNPLGKWRYWHS
ncbi:hypothetical protein BG004_006811 [Podila humilis]|nr:hypothetical protein BG004_006811 [Podila humilis]